MKIRRAYLKETVSVESYAGQGAYGPAYGSAVTVRAHIDATRRLVRDAEGREVVSELTLYVHPDDASAFPPESRVTVAGAHVSTVITSKPQTFRGRVSHCEVSVS